MESCDVLIVGGGPAGSTCARRLVDAGLDVVVLDKEEFPRDKVCAGWITPQVAEVLELEAQGYASGRTFQPITGFSCGRMGGRSVTVRYAEPVSYGIRRCEFDEFLLRRSGARLRLGESVRRIERARGQWRVNDAIRSPLLVGAGGHFCPVARHVGASPSSRAPLVAAQEAEWPLSPAELEGCPVAGELPRLDFCRDLLGYGWCFRKGDFLNVGLGRIGTGRLPARVASFCETLRRKGVLTTIPRGFRGHAYRLWQGAPSELHGEGWLLVGDAAGVAYPESGEGIRPAVESGLLAAAVLAESRGRFGAARMEEYARAVARRFGEPRRAGWAERIPARWRLPLAGWALERPWFARRAVLERGFLRRGQPALAV